MTEIEQALSVSHTAQQEIRTSLRRAGTIRQAVLREAFVGHLVPHDSSEEPNGARIENHIGHMKP